MITVQAEAMASLAPPPTVVPCGTLGVLVVTVVDPITDDGAAVAVAGVSVRLTVNGIQAVSPTEASGATAFSVRSVTSDVIQAAQVVIEYQAPCDPAWRRVDFPAVPAYHQSKTQRIDLQRVGYELECADVKLAMHNSGGDTYGYILAETTVAGYNALPLVKLELEERKGTEDPKIEVMTAPLMTADLGRAKQWLNTVADACGGRTSAQLVTAAPANLTWQAGAHANYVANNVFVQGAGARLVQTNVDLYLDQLYTCPNLMKSMMHGLDKRPAFYDKARTCIMSLSAGAPLAGNDARSHVAGVLTYALFTSLLNDAFQTVPNSLGKDRAQPLVKTGVDELARSASALTAGERTALFDAVKLLASQPAPPEMVELCKSPMNASARPLTEAFVRSELERWFLTRRARYPADPLDPQDGNRITGFGTMTNAATPASWDENAGTGQCQCNAAITADAAGYTCPVCNVSNAAPGTCCPTVPTLDPATTTCPGCGTQRLAAAFAAGTQCCSLAIVRDPDVYRCAVGHVRPGPGPCCQSARVKTYVCSRCNSVMPNSRACPTGCNVNIYRPVTRFRCPGCGVLSQSSGNCAHAGVRQQVSRWTCPGCRAAYDSASRPANDQCVHLVVADAQHWTCGACRKGFAALPALGCTHARVVDPWSATCAACGRINISDSQQCPSGKPLPTRCVNNRTMVVAEVRKHEAAFNQKWWENL